MIIENLKEHTYKSEIYLNRYIKFIENIRSKGDRSLSYSESHHIIPKCMGGTNFPENLISLTGREHFLAHWMLWKAFRSYPLTAAFIIMQSGNSQQIRPINSRVYETLRVELSNFQKIRMKGSKNPFFLAKHSEESKRKISRSKRGFPNNSWNTGLTSLTSLKLKAIGESISSSTKGLRHWTNGQISVRSKTCPGEGWKLGRAPSENFKFTKDTKLEMSKARSDGSMSWWNNGSINKRSKGCPGPDFVRGRLVNK